MKKLLLLITIAMPFATYSQITINYSDFPVAGQGFIHAVDDNYIAPIQPGGSNQTWNYAQLLNTDQDTALFVNASSTPYASFFPNSNLAFPGTGFDFAYVISNPNGFYLNGFYSAADSLAIVFDPAQMFIPAPFTFGNSYNGYSRYQVDDTMGGFNIRAVLYSVINIVCDGFGTLILPNQTINNTLRIKTTIINTDSLFIDLGNGYVPMPGQTPNVEYNTDYKWLQSGSNGIMALEIEADSAGTTSNRSSYIMFFGTVDVPENNNNRHTISAIPNPCNNQITFSSDQPFASGDELIIYNHLGKTVGRYNLAHLTRFSMQTGFLPDGVYIYKVISNNNLTGKDNRFIVTH